MNYTRVRLAVSGAPIRSALSRSSLKGRELAASGSVATFDRNFPKAQKSKAWNEDNREEFFRDKYAHVHAKQKELRRDSEDKNGRSNRFQQQGRNGFQRRDNEDRGGRSSRFQQDDRNGFQRRHGEDQGEEQSGNQGGEEGERPNRFQRQDRNGFQRKQNDDQGERTNRFQRQDRNDFQRRDSGDRSARNYNRYQKDDRDDRRKPYGSSYSSDFKSTQRQTSARLKPISHTEYVYGTSAVEAALRNPNRSAGHSVLFILKGIQHLNDNIVKLAKDLKIPINRDSSRRDLNLFTDDGVHNGYALKTRPLSLTSVESLGSWAFKGEEIEEPVEDLAVAAEIKDADTAATDAKTIESQNIESKDVATEANEVKAEDVEAKEVEAEVKEVEAKEVEVKEVEVEAKEVEAKVIETEKGEVKVKAANIKGVESLQVETEIEELNEYDEIEFLDEEGEIDTREKTYKIHEFGEYDHHIVKKNYDVVAPHIKTNALGIYIDQVTDPHNLGAILRSAHFLGADFAILSELNCAKLSPVAAKSAAGAVDSFPIYTCDAPLKLFEKSVAQGWNIVATVPPHIKVTTAKRVSPRDLPLIGLSGNQSSGGPCLLAVGSESEGLRKSLLQRCTHVVSIPKATDTSVEDGDVVDSLNVSVATALLVSNFMLV